MSGTPGLLVTKSITTDAKTSITYVSSTFTSAIFAVNNTSDNSAVCRLVTTVGEDLRDRHQDGEGKRRRQLHGTSPGGWTKRGDKLKRLSPEEGVRNMDSPGGPLATEHPRHHRCWRIHSFRVRGRLVDPNPRGNLHGYHI